MTCQRCGGSGIEPGTIVIPPGHGSGFNSIDPDPLDRGSYVPCSECYGRSDYMGDEEEMGFDPRQFFETLRKSASVKMGAIVFGEAQGAYYDILKQHMTDDDAFNMLAHTTEQVIRGIAMAAGPMCEAMLKGAVVWERFVAEMPKTDKEVPGS